MRNRSIYYTFLLLLWLIATKSTKYISTVASASVRLTLATGLFPFLHVVFQSFFMDCLYAPVISRDGSIEAQNQIKTIAQT